MDKRILKTEKIEKVHIVGISLGAVLAQDFANQYPEAVQSLACFGGYDINNFDAKMQRENSGHAKPRKYPLLIGCGRYDIPMELSAVEMWKKTEPECDMIIFEGAGHCVNMDVPQKFNEVIEKFWKNTL